MKAVEDFYNEFAMDAIICQVEKESISYYTQRQHSFYIQNAACPDKTISLEKFASYTANFVVGRTGAGEKAQLKFLEQKFPTIKALSPRGKESIKFDYDTNNQIAILKGGKKSKVNNIKSFDAMSLEKISKNILSLWVLKSIDIGPFSDSEGGGHQDNVKSEIEAVINASKNSSCTFDKHNVEITIMVDGRSAEKIINEIKLGNQIPNNITLVKSENL